MRIFIYTFLHMNEEMIQNTNGAEISDVKHFSQEAVCHFSDSYFFIITRQVVLTASLLS